MPFEVSGPDQDAIVFIRVWGSAKLDTGTAARKAVSDLAREHGAKRILVDFREAEIRVPLHEYMSYYQSTFQHYAPGTCIALVISDSTVPDPQNDMELTRVLGSMGGMKLRDFRDMEQARAWLLRYC